MQNHSQLVVSVDPTIHQALKVKAAQQQTTIKALVSDAIQRHVLSDSKTKRAAA